MDLEHQRCYLYTPPEAQERPSKRQRTDKPAGQGHLADRLQTFRSIWSHQEERIQATLEEADRATQEKIAGFVAAHSNTGNNQPPAIPTGLIVAGPSIASHSPFFGRLGRKIREHSNCAYVVLTSGESPNLKTLLKNLIKKVTSHLEDDDDEELGYGILATRNGPRMLNFDLGHVQAWQSRNRVESIVVAIQDSEAFDTSVLIELADLLYAWLDRLPFVLLFGIATSAESFEERLSGKTLRLLDGQKFDVTQSGDIIEKLFLAAVASHDAPIRIGPILSRRILDRQKDHVQNVQDFTDGLKYAYMSHFYASYPTLLLKDGLSFKDTPSDVFAAIRNLPSFRRWIEIFLEEGRAEDVRDLLDSNRNQLLSAQIAKHLKSGTDAMNTLSSAARVVFQIRDSLQMTPKAALSSLWVRAASADMLGSPLLRETILTVKKTPSNKLIQLLASLQELDLDDFPLDLDSFQHKLEALVKDHDAAIPLRTQHDVRNESLRTTVVAQKVLLSKHKAALSEQDRAYSDIVTLFHEQLEAYFNKAFIDPKNLFLSELLIYDLKSPHTEVFQPRPRLAIERALASPHDYLGCDCCGANAVNGEEAALGATQPATAILYQLYLETGALINASDLWSAFNTIVGDEEEGNEQQTMALFQRSLAELKHLGFVKPTRKKTDHVTKMMWKGL
ncbi:origin recognition complex subunit [Dendryphion nanum]|uniref:Origin recognition complex subunit n=1 Tax=Dendryphion nanum TaxID=256645 RepID=A0A9P9DRA6_9PLEO|nr:origin recognition complex subunit [Dendryphion nanum]